MLGLQYIRENKEAVLEGLKKRGFKTPEMISQIIDLDKDRRTKQAKLEKHLLQLSLSSQCFYLQGRIERSKLCKNHVKTKNGLKCSNITRI